MRFLGTTRQITVVEQLSKAFSDIGIAFHFESKENLDWGSDDFGTITWTLWVVNEQDVPAAQVLYARVLQNPLQSEPKQQKEITIEVQTIPHQKREPFLPLISGCIFGICLVLFIGSLFTDKGSSIINSPIRQEFLFDFPTSLKKLQKNSKAEETISFFPGFLPLFEFYHGNISKTWEEANRLPKCERIQEGELWRFVTPSLLHQDFLHLVFNMFWLIMLALPLERHFKPIRFLLFTLMAALISNTAQYFITGFSFLGASGLIAAYGGYIYSDVRNNAKSHFRHLYEQTRFLLWMILIFVVLSAGELLTYLLFSLHLPLSIANTAHCTGFLFGYLVARHSFFSSK